jgi:uncharacterized OsmC-like protein
VNARELKDLYERKARAINKRPSFAAESAYARAQVGAELTCEVDLGDRRMRVDVPAEEGGHGVAAHPGQLMRASLGACLAVGYKLWGARLEIPVDAVAVDVTCEYDARGQLGLSPDVRVGWRRVTFEVTVTSAAAEADIRRVVETADRLNPLLANLSPEIERVHRLWVSRPSVR